MSSIRVIFNFAISEYALHLKNPFTGMYYDKTAGVSKRLLIPIEDIRKVQDQCRRIDDENERCSVSRQLRHFRNLVVITVKSITTSTTKDI